MTLAEANAKLSAAMTAYDNALEAESMGVGDRQLTRQRIKALAGEIDRWERKVQTLTAKAAGANNPTVALADFT